MLSTECYLYKVHCRKMNLDKMLLYRNVFYKMLLIPYNVYFSFPSHFLSFLHPLFILSYFYFSSSPHFSSLSYTLHLSFPTFYFSSSRPPSFSSLSFTQHYFLHPPAPQSLPLSPSHITIIFCSHPPSFSNPYLLS